MSATSATSSSSLQETDKLLHKFEIDNIPDQYREYYGIKRNNLFASIQGFPEMWEYYLRLDAIWMRAFGDLRNERDANRMFPLLLYFNAHAKMRVAMELAFSGCMGHSSAIRFQHLVLLRRSEPVAGLYAFPTPSSKLPTVRHESAAPRSTAA